MVSLAIVFYFIVESVFLLWFRPSLLPFWLEISCFVLEVGALFVEGFLVGVFGFPSLTRVLVETIGFSAPFSHS